MTLQMRDEENIEKGIEQGENRMAKLIKVLLDRNLVDVVRQVTIDPELRQKMYEKYHIEDE